DHLNECRIQAHQARSPVPADPRANRPARDPSPSQEARTRQTTRQSRQERLTLAEIPNEATNTLIRSISYEATNYFARRYCNEVTGPRQAAGRGTLVDSQPAERSPNTATIGVTAMMMMVVGSMVGAGVFSLPARFASATGVAGALIA